MAYFHSDICTCAPGLGIVFLIIVVGWISASVVWLLKNDTYYFLIGKKSTFLARLKSNGHN